MLRVGASSKLDLILNTNPAICFVKYNQDMILLINIHILMAS